MTNPRELVLFLPAAGICNLVEVALDWIGAVAVLVNGQYLYSHVYTNFSFI